MTKGNSSAETTKSNADNENGSASSGRKQHLTVWAWDKSFNIFSMEQAEQIYQKEHPDVDLYIITTSWDDIKIQLTWERFIEIGKDIYDKTGLPLVTVQAGNADIINQIVQSTGKTLWNPDGTTNFTNNPELRAAIEIYKEMYDYGVLGTAETWDGYLETFSSGNACGVLNGCWILGYIQTAQDQSGLWQVTNMPRLSQSPNAVNYSSHGGSSWAISSNCSNPELAIDFMASTFAGNKELYTFRHICIQF